MSTSERKPSGGDVLDIPYYNTDHLATLAAAVLQDRCAANRSLENQHRSRYHSSRIPSISITDYMKRVGKYSRCSPECMIIAIVYLDRYVARSQIPVTFRNAHRLIIVSVLVAAKIRDDIYYSNSYYGSIGGLQLQELNALEMDFVQTLDWVTYVTPEEYNMYLCEIARRYQAQIAYGQQQVQQQVQPPPVSKEVPAGPSQQSVAKEPVSIQKSSAASPLSSKAGGAMAGASNDGSDQQE